MTTLLVTDERVTGNVRAEMARARTTQQGLASSLGRTQTWLSRRLTGEVSFTVAELADVARALRVPLAVLVDGVAPDTTQAAPEMTSGAA